MSSTHLGDNRSIEDGHKILRHIGPSHVDGDEVQSAAFTLKDSETGLSFSWVDYFSGTADERVRKAIAEISSAKTVRKSHRFGELVVGKIKEEFAKEGLLQPQPVHRPVPCIDAHCEIDRQYLTDRIVETLLARVTGKLHLPAV